LKCSDAREFLSEISAKSITTQIAPQDLDFLSSKGYVLRSSKADYDLAASDIQNMEQAQQDINERLKQEGDQDAQASQVAAEDLKKSRGLLFDLHGKEYKDEMQEKVQADEETLSKDKVAMSDDEAKISEYIQKKSAFDQLTPCGDEYLSLSGSGVLMLNALNSRMSRVSDMEFSDFAQETFATDTELRAIALRANNYVTFLRARISFST
jgi:hypothetical protein